MYCPRCGASNIDENKCCGACGYLLPLSPVEQLPSVEIPPPQPKILDPDIETYRRLFVGEEAEYYVRHWNTMEQTGAKVVWNWSAFFAGNMGRVS